MADDAAHEDGAPAEETEAVADAPAAPETMHGALVTERRGQKVLHVAREDLPTLVRTLRDEDGFLMCLDVTAVDYLMHQGDRGLPEGVTPERFEVVVNLLDIDAGRRIRLRVQVPEHDATLPTLFDLFPGTEAMEREVYDMFGITFTDHPDLTRILMPEDWEGHPLRKDYEVGSIPVQFKGAPS